MGSAPGRVCLVGEHCDWAGGAAITLPLDETVEIHVEPADRWSARSLADGREHTWTEGEPVGLFFLVPAVASVLGASPHAVDIRSNLPMGRGFSSSAAFAVALVRALAPGIAVEPAAEAAWHAEHAVAGVACGRMDPLACAYGVPLFLRFEGESVAAEPLSAKLDLAVGSFAAPRDTRGILDVLGRHHRGDVPLRDWSATARVGAVRGAIELFGAQAIDARVALLDGDLAAVGGAMNVCQDVYEEELMVSFPELAAPNLVRAVRTLRANGALGAKFSGAGGDGSVIGLYRPGQAAAGVLALDALGLKTGLLEVWCTR